MLRISGKVRENDTENTTQLCKVAVCLHFQHKLVPPFQDRKTGQRSMKNNRLE